MIVRNNGYWRARIRRCRGGDCSMSPVNYDWKCKTIRVKLIPSHSPKKLYSGRRISVGRIVMFSPGRY